MLFEGDIEINRKKFAVEIESNSYTLFDKEDYNNIIESEYELSSTANITENEAVNIFNSLENLMNNLMNIGMS